MLLSVPPDRISAEPPFEMIAPDARPPDETIISPPALTSVALAKPPFKTRWKPSTVPLVGSTPLVTLVEMATPKTSCTPPKTDAVVAEACAETVWLPGSVSSVLLAVPPAEVGVDDVGDTERTG